MKNHLLSFYPIRDLDGYARLSCVALGRVDGTCGRPIVFKTEADLRNHLSQVLAPVSIEDVLSSIELRQTTQLEIDDQEARCLGFLPYVH